ncbi:hypothetical protein, partial [Vibrio campbellii]
SHRISVSIVLGMVLVMVLLLAKQIITLYHVVQKILTKDQHTLVIPQWNHNLTMGNSRVMIFSSVIAGFWQRLEGTGSTILL